MDRQPERPDRIEQDIETLAGDRLHPEATRRFAAAPPTRQAVPANTLDYFARELEAIGFTVEEDAVGNFLRAEPTEGRAGLRDRIALRLEPEWRQVRRDDGRGHRARGLPAEPRAGSRPAAPARLVPRGGGIRLRSDAPRQPDHRAPGPPRTTSREKFRSIDDGRSFWEHCGRPRLLPGALARVQPTCSTTSPAGSRCTSSRHGCSRTPATGSCW